MVSLNDKKSQLFPSNEQWNDMGNHVFSFFLPYYPQKNHLSLTEKLKKKLIWNNLYI